MLIDLWTHIVPLQGDLIFFSSGETMHTEHDFDARSRLWYVKNRNAEEFWLRDGGIWRGRDTSHGDTTYYDTYTDNTRNTYGHVWLPRVVEVGATYTERAYTVIKRKDTHTEQAAYDATYRIEIDYHETITLPSQITLPRVVQLIDRNADGVHYESKYYAHNHGLVWWRNELTGVETFMTGSDRRKPAQTRDRFGLADVPVNDDPSTPHPKHLQTAVTLSATAPSLRVRSAPSLTAPIVTTFGATLETFTNDTLVTERDGYTWRPFVRRDACVVWAAEEFLQVDYHEIPEAEPDPTPEPEPQPDGCIPQLLKQIGATMTTLRTQTAHTNTLANPTMSAPYERDGNLHIPNGWRIDLTDFPGAVSERANVWAQIAGGWHIESGHAQFALSWWQTVTLAAGRYTVGFDYQPDINPVELNNDGTRLAFNEDYFFNIDIEAGKPFYASDTPANRGALMDRMNLNWVNDYPSTGFDDHSHKARTLTTARYLTITEATPLRVAFGCGSKWGRTAGKLYVKSCYLTRTGDVDGTPDEDGCLARLLNLIGR